MEQKRKPKYEKPEIRELGRTGDDDMRAAGDCSPTGSGDFSDCHEGNSAAAGCFAGNDAGFCIHGEGE
jgi:hypothetical protein